MSKHTPGPWRPRNGIVLADSHKGTHCSDEDIAFYGGPLVCESIRTDANARLIAAAPDLLEALKAMLEYYGSHTACVECQDMARAAIAKAEGKA
ncbi:MAG TPA: hypothetical protein VLA31_02160 [Burkholderiaceae bacterium]|nr:hypothetical protein [Burkholderiaceae bacterium]